MLLMQENSLGQLRYSPSFTALIVGNLCHRHAVRDGGIGALARAQKGEKRPETIGISCLVAAFFFTECKASKTSDTFFFFFAIIVPLKIFTALKDMNDMEMLARVVS